MCGSDRKYDNKLFSQNSLHDASVIRQQYPDLGTVDINITTGLKPFDDI